MNYGSKTCWNSLKHQIENSFIILAKRWKISYLRKRKETITDSFWFGTTLILHIYCYFYTPFVNQFIFKHLAIQETKLLSCKFIKAFAYKEDKTTFCQSAYLNCKAYKELDAHMAAKRCQIYSQCKLYIQEENLELFVLEALCQPFRTNFMST